MGARLTRLSATRENPSEPPLESIRLSVSLVVTVIGPDRPGLVEALSQAVTAHDGNWLESRMARLEGQFAGILCVDVPEVRAEALAEALRGLAPEGLEVVVARAQAAPRDTRSRQLRLELIGSDRPGIIRDIAQALAGRGVNVDELRTGVESAPMSGEQLFRANAELRVPAELEIEGLRKTLEAIASDLMVDIALDESAG